MNRSISIYVVILVGTVLLCLASFWVIQWSESNAESEVNESATCISNLVLIQAAKHNWAMVNKADGFSVPPDAILDPKNDPPFFDQRVSCPLNGTYRLGSVLELPTCSIGGPGHQL